MWLDREAWWGPTIGSDQEETMGTAKCQRIELFSETTDEEIAEIQNQPGTVPVQIQGHVVAGTVPDECELQQGRFEFKIFAFLIPYIW